MKIPYVTQDNWRNIPEFKDFLTFAFKPSAETSRQCLLLLPIAVAEERMIGAIKESILSEAIRIWNTPPTLHYFYYSDRLSRWTYKGDNATKCGLTNYIAYGRLHQPLLRGAFCNAPKDELLVGYTLIAPEIKG